MSMCGERRCASLVMELFLRIRMDSSLQIARRVPVYLFRAIVLRRQKYINATEDINARKINLRTLFYPIEKDFFITNLFC